MAAELLIPPIRRFLAAPGRYATIATLNRDGAPHQTVVWYLLRGDAIVLNSRIGRRWPANARRDPRVSLAVEEGEDAITMAGLAEVVAEGEQALADISEMAWRYYDAETARREIARYETEQRITFNVRPLRIHVHGTPG